MDGVDLRIWREDGRRVNFNVIWFSVYHVGCSNHAVKPFERKTSAYYFLHHLLVTYGIHDYFFVLDKQGILLEEGG